MSNRIFFCQVVEMTAKQKTSSTANIEKKDKPAVVFDVGYITTELRECEVYDAKDERKTKIKMSEILDSYKGHRVIIVFFRRFGCPFCRAIATGLKYMMEHELKNVDVKLFGIARELKGFTKFDKEQYFLETIYVNEGGSIFDLFDMKRGGAYNAFGLGFSDFRKIVAAMKLTSLNEFISTSDYKGDWLQLGGIVVLNEQQTEALFYFREDYAGDSPFVYDICACLNAAKSITDDVGAQTRLINYGCQQAIKHRKPSSKCTSKHDEIIGI